MKSLKVRYYNKTISLLFYKLKYYVRVGVGTRLKINGYLVQKKKKKKNQVGTVCLLVTFYQQPCAVAYLTILSHNLTFFQLGGFLFFISARVLFHKT